MSATSRRQEEPYEAFLTMTLLFTLADLVTLQEPEISPVRLAQRCYDDTGERVRIDDSVKRRAVSIFVRNRPWPEVWRLVGEATGSEYTTGQLLAKEDLSEKAVSKRLIASFQRALQSPNYASSFARLVLERVGRTPPPLGRTVLFDGQIAGQGRMGPSDGASESKPPLSRVRIAYRIMIAETQIATESTAADGERKVVEETIPGETPLLPAWEILKGVEWIESDLPIRHLGYVWTMGDYLALLHRKTGRSAIGPALRIAMDAPGSDHENGTVTERGWPGQLLRRPDGFVATSPLGDGLWPADLAKIDALDHPGLMEAAQAATGQTAIQRAWIADGDFSRRGTLATKDEPATYHDQSSALRLAAVIGNDRLSELSGRPRWRMRDLPSDVQAALRLYATEDSHPRSALTFGDAFDLAIGISRVSEPLTLYLTSRIMSYGARTPEEKRLNEFLGSRVLRSESATQEGFIVQWGDSPDLNATYDLGFFRRAEVFRRAR